MGAVLDVVLASSGLLSHSLLMASRSALLTLPSSRSDRESIVLVDLPVSINGGLSF